MRREVVSCPCRVLNARYGYEDKWDENGVFLYTREGQVTLRARFLCGTLSSPRWSETRRRCSSTRLCFRFCTPCSGFPGLGLLWRCVGKVGFLQRLRGEAASALLYQSSSYLLRTHSLQNVADLSLTEELIAEAKLWRRG
jgi:hypothetical protein